MKVRGAHRNRDGQPGKVQLKKINTNSTYLATTNYWAPLNEDIEEKGDEIEHINHTTTTQPIVHMKSNKWTQRME
jgi:hypothetical protein